MPNPSKAELWTQLSNAIKIYDQIYQFGASNSPNYITLEDTLIQSLEGIHTRDTMEVLGVTRTRLNNAYFDGRVVVFHIIRNLAISGYNSSGTTVNDYLSDIFDGMDDGGETIKNRNWTFASVSATVSNYDGTVYRCTHDKANNDIESGQAGTIKLECIADKNDDGIVSGREKIKIYGSGIRKKDELDVGEVTSEISELRAIRAEDGLLINPSFDAIEDTITKNQQVGWHLSSTTNFAKETSDVYRLSPDSEIGTGGTGAALKFSDNGTVTQYFQREKLGVTLDPNVPVFLILYYMRKNSADGTLTLRLGSQTAAVDVSTKTNDVWNALTIGTGASDDGYPGVFNEDYLDTTVTPNQRRGVRIQISLASNTIGDVVIDNVILAQPTKFNGLFYLVPSGSLSGDLLKGDYFTFADTCAETGRNQYTISRFFGRHLPHTSGIPTYADA